MANNPLIWKEFFPSKNTKPSWTYQSSQPQPFGAFFSAKSLFCLKKGNVWLEFFKFAENNSPCWFAKKFFFFSSLLAQSSFFDTHFYICQTSILLLKTRKATLFFFWCWRRSWIFLHRLTSIRIFGSLLEGEWTEKDVKLNF